MEWLLAIEEAKNAVMLQNRKCSITSMHNSTAVLGAADLSSRSNSKTNTIIAEECRLCTTVAAKVEVDVGSVLVGARQTILSTEWVPVCRAEVVDHNND
jgi:hypothetical protein